MRQQWTLTPRLTLQAYAQLFTAYGVYGDTYEGTTDGARRPILFSSLVPVASPENNDFHDVGLNMNVVLRWEYRLGSTLFLVYTHGHQRLPVAEGVRAPITLLPVGLPAGPATDALLIKSTWYWDV